MCSTSSSVVVHTIKTRTVSSESELELESESAATILAESVAQRDDGLEEEPLVDDLPDEDFPDRDLSEVLPEEVLGGGFSSGSHLQHLEAT
jgi:hypothetical protein